MMFTQTPTTDRLDVKESAAAIRKELRAAFPAATFRVTCARGTSHGWVNIDWTDGPTRDSVEAIASRYEAERFDGMTDGYTLTGNTLGSLCGVIYQRTHSQERRDNVRARLLRHDDTGAPHIVTDAHEVAGQHGDDERVVWRYMQATAA